MGVSPSDRDLKAFDYVIYDSNYGNLLLKLDHFGLFLGMILDISYWTSLFC